MMDEMTVAEYGTCQEGELRSHSSLVASSQAVTAEPEFSPSSYETASQAKLRSPGLAANTSVRCLSPSCPRAH